MVKATDKHKHCNHHHEMTDDHVLVDFGDGEFVANKMAVPLLQALNDLGIRTRTHHVDEHVGFVSILIRDGMELQIRKVTEPNSTRDKYDGETEVLLTWNHKRNGK